MWNALGYLKVTRKYKKTNTYCLKRYGLRQTCPSLPLVCHFKSDFQKNFLSSQSYPVGSHKCCTQLQYLYLICKIPTLKHLKCISKKIKFQPQKQQVSKQLTQTVLRLAQLIPSHFFCSFTHKIKLMLLKVWIL